MEEESTNESIVQSEEHNKFLFPVSGKEVKTLKELKEFLENTDEEEFSYHLNEERNDFENWVRDALNEEELAELIKRKGTKEGVIQVIDYFLTKQEIEHPEKAKHDDIPDITWIKTSIQGFDELLPQGIPKRSSILLSGGPGTGKTTFCLQILGNAAKEGENCLYLTFEEEVVNLRRHMKNYGFDPIKLEKDGRLMFKKMRPFDLSRSVEALLAKANGELTIDLDEIEGIIPKGFRPDRIILDSLSAVGAAFAGKEEGYRVYIEQLFDLFKNIGATSFLITENEQSTNKYSRSGIEEFLADGVIVMYNIRNKNIRSNALEILKLRGTSHQKKIVPFKMISNKGIVVYPMEEVFTG
jgi:KaiC/GvpD/RAD55 family RecA-like ATPase